MTRQAVPGRPDLMYEVITYMQIPGGRTPDRIMVYIRGTPSTPQRVISEDIILVLRRIVMTEEANRAPGLVHGPAFQAHLRGFLDDYRHHNRPTIRGELEYAIPILLHRNILGHGFRVETIELDLTRREDPPPPPPEPPPLERGPVPPEHLDWVRRAITHLGSQTAPAAIRARQCLLLYEQGSHEDDYMTVANVDNYFRATLANDPGLRIRLSSHYREDVDHWLRISTSFQAFVDNMLGVDGQIGSGLLRLNHYVQHRGDEGSGPIALRDYFIERARHSNHIMHFYITR